LLMPTTFPLSLFFTYFSINRSLPLPARFPLSSFPLNAKARESETSLLVDTARVRLFFRFFLFLDLPGSLTCTSASVPSSPFCTLYGSRGTRSESFTHSIIRLQLGRRLDCFCSYRDCSCFFPCVGFFYLYEFLSYSPSFLNPRLAPRWHAGLKKVL